MVRASLKATVDYLEGVFGEPTAADNLLDTHESFLDLVRDYPEMYPFCDDLCLRQEGYRKAPIESYVILYRIVDEVVYISHFFHQSQDYAKYV